MTAGPQNGDSPDLLLMRVARKPAAPPDFEAVPFRIQQDFISPLPAAEKERCLIELGSLLHSADYGVQHSAQGLFAKMGGDDPEVKRRVRAAWVASGDPSLILCAAQSFRQEPPQTLFTEEEGVVALLRAASRLGSELHGSVASKLLAASSNGARSGTPGEPMPEDVAIRDQAKNVAHRYPHGSVESTFYDGVASQAQASIDALQRMHEEQSLR